MPIIIIIVIIIIVMTPVLKRSGMKITPEMFAKQKKLQRVNRTLLYWEDMLSSVSVS